MEEELEWMISVALERRVGRAGSGWVCGFATGMARGGGGGLRVAESGGRELLIAIGVTGRLLSAFFVAHDAVGGSVAATDTRATSASQVDERKDENEPSCCLRI